MRMQEELITDNADLQRITKEHKATEKRKQGSPFGLLGISPCAALFNSVLLILSYQPTFVNANFALSADLYRASIYLFPFFAFSSLQLLHVLFRV